jgi:PAS domain S-box-containing protein
MELTRKMRKANFGDGYKIFVLSIVAGLFVWVIDAAIDALFFYEGSFLDLLIFEVTTFEIYFRSVILAVFVTYGIVASRIFVKRKKAEEALRISEERLQAIITFAKDAIILADSDLKISYWNPAAETMLGYTKEEANGKDLFKLLTPERLHEEYLKTWEELKETGHDPLTAANTFEPLAVRKNGTEFPVELSISSLQIRDKWHAVGMVRDITERKLMQRKLEEYSQHLEEMVEMRTRQLKETQEKLIKNEKLAAIGQVASMVGHDLRNPLTGITGAAYYLKKKLGSKADKTTLEMLGLIEKSVEYSNKIISDVLDYSREIQLELTETTPKSITKEALSLVKVPSNISVLDATQDEPKIKVDAEKMKRVFVNIIKNAIDAMPESGKLTITSDKDGTLEITFADTGTGMPKEVLEKLWTPFFTTKARGMGLGLPICKHIVEAHGGNISVESTVGKGTKFIVTIPIQPQLERGEKV